MEYAKITLDRSALPRVVEKTLTILNEGKTPAEKVDGMKIKSLLRIVDGQIKFESKATNQYEKVIENKLHLAVIAAEQQIFKEELIEIARQSEILMDTNQEIIKTFTTYTKIFH